jgi:heme A synthase
MSETVITSNGSNGRHVTHAVVPPEQFGTAAVWTHRLALAACVVSFLLITLGGHVTSTGSGDAEATWPFGAFRAAWDWWIEMGHRYLGMVVGVLVLALTATVEATDDRPRARMLGRIALGWVVVQGLLGGLRIYFPDAQYPNERAAIAVVHTCVGQSFFAFLAAFALYLSPSWRRADAESVEDARVGTMRFVANAAPVLLLTQIGLGALVRHLGHPIVTMLHIIMALLVIGWVYVVGMVALARYPMLTGLRRTGAVLVGLVTIQLFFGLAAYGVVDRTNRAINLAAVVPTLHLAVGVMCLVTSVLLAVRLGRWVRPPADGNTAAEPETPAAALPAAT